MTKAVSADLLAHLKAKNTTLVTCWKVIRTDGTVLAFTDHDKVLTLDADGDGNVTYQPSNSFLRSAVETGEVMAVDHLDVVGILDSDEITEADLIGGRYDNAEVKIFLVNWKDLSQGILKERRGWLGEVDLRDYGFTAELLGLTQAYTDRIVELISPGCMAELGDARCGVTLEPADWLPNTAYVVGNVVLAVPFNDRQFVVTQAGTSAASAPAWDTTIGNTTDESAGSPSGTVIWIAEDSYVKFGAAASITDRKKFTVDGIETADTGYFDNGLLTFTSGQNNGIAREVQSWSEISGQEYEVVVHLPFPFDIEATSPFDSFKVTIGCDKTVANCITPFDNIVNFRGFPFVPGQDATLRIQR